MAQSACTEATGNTMIRDSLDKMAPVLQVDIRSVLDQARLSSASITQVVDHYTDLMSRITYAEVLSYLNSMAGPTLYRLQTELQSLQQQMATYAGAMSLDDSEFHHIQANAAKAIMIAEIYLSQVNLLPATTLHPATTIFHTDWAQNDQSEINNLNTLTTPVQANVDAATTSTTPSTDETADDTTRMQIDDKPFLQIGLLPDEIDQIDRLLEEPMEDPINPPTTGHGPRDELYPSTSEPILMTFGPGDIEVTVAASIGPEVPAEEIVDNKTIRINREEPPPEIPGVGQICQGCTTAGHTMDLCPKLTNCQQYKLKGWISAGVDRLSASFENLAKSRRLFRRDQRHHLLLRHQLQAVLTIPRRAF